MLLYCFSATSQVLKFFATSFADEGSKDSYKYYTIIHLKVNVMHINKPNQDKDEIFISRQSCV